MNGGCNDDAGTGCSLVTEKENEGGFDRGVVIRFLLESSLFLDLWTRVI